MFHTGIVSFLSDFRAVARIRADAEQVRPHPRLFLLAGEEGRVTEAVKSQKTLSEAYAVLERMSRKFLNEPVCRRILKGKRLLPTSQAILKKVFCLSLMYRLGAGEAYARRAIREMMAVCRFPDWHPAHYLDTAEITLALAVGYDWLYGILPARQRRRIRRALLLKGIVPSLGKFFWVKKHNWNNVCCTGVAVGAIAVYESFPKTAARFISRAVAANRRCMTDAFAGGCCPEGYSYWAYAANFQVLLFDALEHSFSRDLSFYDGGDFLRSARTASMLSTPSGRPFCYSDSDADERFLYALVWLARKSADGSLLYAERQKIPRALATDCEDNRLLPMLLVFGYGIKWDRIPVPVSNCCHCDGNVPVFVYRSGWDDPKDTYLAVKGGRAADNHGHLDAGSFVFASDAVHWAVDLGKEDYYALEAAGVSLFDYSQESARWDIFRNGPLSHNVLLVDGCRPAADARVPLVRHWSEEGRSGCALEMTPFYGGSLVRCSRTVEVDAGDTLTVCDSFRCGRPGLTLRWAMCTEASAEVEGQRIILTSNGYKRILTAICRYGTTAFAFPAFPEKPFERDNGACSIVGFFISGIAADLDICIRVCLSRIS